MRVRAPTAGAAENLQAWWPSASGNPHCAGEQSCAINNAGLNCEGPQHSNAGPEPEDAAPGGPGPDRCPASGCSVLGPPARGPPAVTAATATGPTFPWASSLPPFLCSEARAEKATCRWKVTCSQPRLRTFPRRAGSSQGLGLLGLRIPKPLPSGRPERPPRG